jgi:hypothetical protein
MPYAFKDISPKGYDTPNCPCQKYLLDLIALRFNPTDMSLTLTLTKP